MSRLFRHLGTTINPFSMKYHTLRSGSTLTCETMDCNKCIEQITDNGLDRTVEGWWQERSRSGDALHLLRCSRVHQLQLVLFWNDKYVSVHSLINQNQMKRIIYAYCPLHKVSQGANGKYYSHSEFVKMYKPLSSYFSHCYTREIWLTQWKQESACTVPIQTYALTTYALSHVSASSMWYCVFPQPEIDMHKLQ